MSDKASVSGSASNPDIAAQLASLAPLLGRPIAFHRRLVDVTASVKAALLLSQMLYWVRHGHDGWFYKTAAQWLAETGLSVHEQTSARRRLRECAILTEQRLGMPAKLHFRIEKDTLAALLVKQQGAPPARIDWNDRATVTRLLGAALPYRARLAAIAGGVHAALLLSHTLALLRRESPGAGEVRRRLAQWSEAIGFTRREQEAARRALRSAGLWEERTTGSPARLAVRLRLDVLQARLSASGEAPPRVQETPANALPDPAVTTGQAGGGEAQPMHVSANLVLPKAPFQFRQKRHARFAESAIFDEAAYITLLTIKNRLQPPQGASTCHDAGGSPGGGGDLILPERLPPEEHAQALALVQPHPERAQALLDELAGRLEAKAVHTSALGYLRGLVKRAQAGTFVPELGLGVAAARQKRHQEQGLLEQQRAEARRQADERASPDYQAKAQARRAELQRVLDSLSCKRLRGGTA